MHRIRQVIIVLLALLPFLSYSQEVKTRPSPLAIATARYKDTYVKITYGQPQKKGRPIFGALVPYSQVWRAGANEATEITVTKDVIISGNLLKAGTYSIFTIPEKDNWTVIFNKDVGLWGSYNYNLKTDAFRLVAPVQRTPDAINEFFTIAVDQKNEKADLVFMWDDVQVRVPIQFIEPK